MRKLLPCLLLCAPAFCQVALNNTNTMAHSSTSIGASMTVTAGGANIAAFACVGWDNAASGMSINSVSYGGQSMTPAGAAATNNGNGNHINAQIFYLINPPTGSNTLAISATGTNNLYGNIVSFTGVNQTTPVRSGTYQAVTGSTANPSVTIASNAGSSSNPADLTMTCIEPTGGGFGTTNQTRDGANVAGNFSMYHDHATAPAATVTHIWTGGANTWALAGFSIMSQPPAPVLTFSGCPASGNYGTASTSCTVSTTQTFDGVHSVIITDSNPAAPGTFTPSIGSPSVGSVTVTPASGSTSFTFTYKPATVGARALTTTNTFSPMWQNAAWSYAATSAQPCTFTMTGNGSQSIAATSGWTSTGSCGHSSPTTGDSLVATANGGSLTITVPNDGVTHMLGSCPPSNTTYDLQLTAVSAGSAVFDVQPGAKFYFCGNKLLTAPSAGTSGVPTTWADLKYETGATVYEDEAQASYAHRTTTAAASEWTRLLWGSSTDTCAYGPGTAYSCPTNVQSLNVGSVNPVMYDPGGTTDSHIFKIYGTAIKGGCGSATVGCLHYETDGNTSREAYADAGVVYLGGDVFDTTGTLQSSTNGFYKITQLSVTSSHFVNDLVGFAYLNGNGGVANLQSCVITGSYFSQPVTNTNTWNGGCAWTGNVFGYGLPTGSSASLPWSAFSYNVLLLDCATGNPYTDRAINAPVLFNYVSCFTNAGSNHGFQDSTWNMTYRGNIYETLTTGSSEGHFALGTPPTASNTVVVLDNISLPAPNGVNSGQIYGWGNGGTQNVGHLDHNGAYGTGDFSWIAFLEHAGNATVSNTVLRSLRANVGWATGAGVGDNLALNTCQGCLSAALAATPANNVYISLEGWNAWYNAASDNTFNATLANSNCNPSTSSNTPYQQCTASGTPGTHDIAGNPKLVDPTRGMFKWASVMRGQAASLAGAQAAFQGCQNLLGCIMQLEWWVRAGYQPTNLALKGAAHDGGVVGVTGTPGSGYSGACSATVAVQDSDDLGTGAVLTCSFVGGIPAISVVNPGIHYRVATPATVTITGTGGGGTSLNVAVSPSDIGPVPITLFAGVAP